LPDAGHIPDAFFTSSECERLRHHVDDFLEDELQSDSVLAIEGPEICSLMPVWIDRLEAARADVRVLHVFRHPASVAASLAHHAGLSRSESDLLWLRHHLAAHKHTRTVRHGLVSFEEFAHDCERSIASWAEILDVRWPHDVASVMDAIQCTVADTGLASASSGMPSPSELTPAVAETFRALIALTGSGAAVRKPVHCADDLLSGLYGLFDLMISIRTARSSTTPDDESQTARHVPGGRTPGGLTGNDSGPGDDLASLSEMLRCRDFELVRRDRELRGLDRRVAELSSELCWARAQMVRLVEEIQSLHVADTHPRPSTDDTQVMS
jgi:hypothetical protein